MSSNTTAQAMLAEGSTVTFHLDDGTAVPALVTTARHEPDALGRQTHALTLCADSPAELERLADVAEADLVTVESHGGWARLRVIDAAPYDAATDGAEAAKLVVGVTLQTLRPD